MTSEELDTQAAEWLQRIQGFCIEIGPNPTEQVDRAIKALERRQAQDVRINEGKRECPKCGDRIRITGPGGVPNAYCGNCGQKLRWTKDTQRLPWE